MERGIDRTNEHSFSDADFPKTIVRNRRTGNASPVNAGTAARRGSAGNRSAGNARTSSPTPSDLQDTARGDLTPGSDN